MPLTVNPFFVPSGADLEVLSSDGLLRASLDEEWAGVLLAADLRGLALAQALRNGNFAAAVASSGDPNWNKVDSATLTRSSSGGAVGSGPYLTAAITSGQALGGTGIEQVLTKPWLPGMMVELTLWLKTPSSGVTPASFRVQLLNNGNRIRTILYDNTSSVVVGTAWKKHTIKVRMGLLDPIVTSVKLYGYSDPGTAISIQFSDIVARVPAPAGVRFWRESEGVRVPVRGGDFKRTASGYAKTYDNEAPIGKQSTYTAEPVYGPLGDFAGTPTATATLMVPPGLYSTWIKSLEDPSLSVLCMINDWSSIGKSSYTSYARTPGTSLPGGVFDAMSGFSGTATFVTMTEEASETMEALVNQGVVLIQTDPKYKRPKNLYVVVDSWARNDFATMDSEEKTWEINYTQIERPDTYGQPTRMPLSSYKKRLADYPSFASVPSRTYADAMSI